MAAYTIPANATFPSGSTVGAYLTDDIDRSGVPVGSPVVTATAGSNGSVMFIGLTESTTYFAMTQVSSVWRRRGFTTAPLGSIPVGAPVAGPKGDKGDKGDEGDEGPAGSAGPELTAEIADRQAQMVAHVLNANDPHGDQAAAAQMIADTLTSIAQATPEYAAALAALSVPMMRVQALTADFVMPSPKTTAIAIPGAFLTLDGGADEMWVWDLSLRFDTTGAQDLRLDLIRPAGSLEGNWGAFVGPSSTVQGWTAVPAGGTDPLTPSTLAGALAFRLRSGRTDVALRVLIVGNGSSGPVQVTMRQNTTNAADMTLTRGPIGSAVRMHA